MSVVYDSGEPDEWYDGECTVTITRAGAVTGDFPVAEYDWYVPGDGGVDPGPVFEFNQWTETKTYEEGNYFGGYEARAGIELSVVDTVPIPSDLDEAHAKDKTVKNVRCGPDAEGFGDPPDLEDVRELVPDPRDLQDQSNSTAQDAKETLCLQATLPFCG